MFKEVKSSTGLTIAIPTLGRNPTMEWAWSFKMLTPPMNYNVRFSQIWNRPIDEARNACANEAVLNESKYLFFLGDDTEVPAHTLRQLIMRMEHDDKLGVVGGVYCSKSDPPAPLVFRGNGVGSYWDWKVGEYFEVTGLGMDCTLIRTEVFKHIERPWFKTVDSDEFMDGNPKGEIWTEDLYFLKKVVEETDFSVYCDATVICHHWDSPNRKRYDLPADSKPVRRDDIEFKSGDKKILDLGCGPVHWQFHEEGVPIRVDIREECNPDYRCDLRDLPFDKEFADVVFSSHVLEHFGRLEFDELITEWLRVMKPTGEFRIIIPNIAWAAERIVKGEIDNNVLNVLYGSQEYPQNFHKNGFTPERLEELLSERGLVCADKVLDGYNIIMRFLYKEAYDALPEGELSSIEEQLLDQEESELEEENKDEISNRSEIGETTTNGEGSTVSSDSNQ